MAVKVRYLVTGKCFVNGSLYEPTPRGPTFVMADAGLEGKALQLAPEAAPREPAPIAPAAPRAAKT